MRPKPAHTSLPHGQSLSAGFTLIELLVAMAVFLLIAVTVASLADSTAKITSLSNSRLGADATARLALDRMGVDFSRAILRPELPDRIEKLNGNDRLVFYVRTDSYNSNHDRGISAVAYEVQNFMLMRGVNGFTWTDTQDDASQLFFVGMTWPPGEASFVEDRNAAAARLPQVESTDEERFEVLSPGVFRFEYCFLLKDGTLSTLPIMTPPAPTGVTRVHQTNGPASPTASSDASSSYQVGSRWYRPSSGVNASRTFICISAAVGHASWRRLGWNDVRAVVIGIASLDPDLRSAHELTTTQIEALAAIFGDAEDGKDILEAWQGWRDDLDAIDLPRPVVNSVRVRQRFFILDH
jgi:prepilin-type N-terminal cleavage/methylation domain-containing protein